MKVHIGHIDTTESPRFIEGAPLHGDVFQIAVTDHPAASKGVPKVVGFTGKTGNLCLIRENGLHPAEIDEVLLAVKAWQDSKQERE
jgi:hypothetical protein